MKERTKKAAWEAANCTQSAAKEMLEKHFGTLVSQAMWEQVAIEIRDIMLARLAESEFVALVESGDLYNSKGDVNAAGILEGINKLQTGSVGKPIHAQLAYLENHVRVTFTKARLIAGTETAHGTSGK